MKKPVIVVLAVLGLILLPILVEGQEKDPTDKTWPALSRADGNVDEGQPRFVIESQKLQLSTAAKVSSSWIPNAFFSEWKDTIKGSTLRTDVMMHHYPDVLFDSHFRATGTYVFYLPKEQVFYLWGDCGMDHGDAVAGPFAGDPRLVLKQLSADAK